MKELHYDPVKRTWYQTFEEKANVMFGKFFAVPFKKEHHPKHFTFPCFMQDLKTGPLIGIMASPEKKGFIGNIPLFKRIQKTLYKEGGGISIVFTPDKLTDNGITGFCYLPEHDQWIRMKTPLPDIIYNRIARYKDEKELLAQIEKLTSLYHIPILNPSFFDKWELYLQLKDHETLAPYLPDTALLSQESLEEFFTNYSAVYIKKRLSHKGKGVYLITKNGHTFLMKTTATTTVLFPNIKKLIRYFQKEAALNDYIIQKAIPTVRMNGKKFDYRVLAHLHKNRFRITGIGVRMAKKQQVTTHVPAGGVIVSTEDLPIQTDIMAMERIIRICGKQLSHFYDDIGEFSADIGVMSDGMFYIFELNAKPMDFDEAIIKKQAAENITKVFYEKTDFIKQDIF